MKHDNLRGTMRWSSFAATVVALLCLRAGVATAQLPGAASLPTMLHLKNVPVGSAATYRVLTADKPPMRQQVALVARSDKAATLEISVGPEPATARGLVRVRLELVFRSNGTWTPGAMAIQVGSNRPMALPPPPPTQGSMVELIDKASLGQPETIRVAAGRFKARRHLSKGTTKIAWMNEDVLPFGLVKLSEGRAGATVDMELVERATGSKPGLLGTPVPFDANQLMQQMAEAQAGGAR